MDFESLWEVKYLGLKELKDFYLKIKSFLKCRARKISVKINNENKC